MNRKLSVVVPVYNTETYLCQCIESILNQTYADIELILVNDGSTDSSGKICSVYGERDRRVKVLHKKNEGPIKARFSGAGQATGNYITFVDSDDWIEPNTYERMMKHMGQSDVVIAGVYRYFSEDRIKTDMPMLEEGFYDRKAVEDGILPYMLWSNKRNTWELDPSLCTKIFNKALLADYLENACKLGVHFGDDSAVIFPFMLRADSAVIVHECFYFHRQRSQGAVPSYFRDDSFFEKIFVLYEYLKSEFSRSAYWEALSSQLEHFYINAVQLKQQSFLDYKEVAEDVFPFWEIKKDAAVVLYGAGEAGKKFYRQNGQYHFCEIVLWVDKNWERLCKGCEQIVSPARITAKAFDYVVIAVRSAGVVQEIMKELASMGIPAEKMIWNGVLVQKILPETGKN